MARMPLAQEMGAICLRLHRPQIRCRFDCPACAIGHEGEEKEKAQHDPPPLWQARQVSRTKECHSFSHFYSGINLAGFPNPGIDFDQISDGLSRTIRNRAPGLHAKDSRLPHTHQHLGLHGLRSLGGALSQVKAARTTIRVPINALFHVTTRLSVKVRIQGEAASHIPRITCHSPSEGLSMETNIMMTPTTAKLSSALAGSAWSGIKCTSTHGDTRIQTAMNTQAKSIQDRCLSMAVLICHWITKYFFGPTTLI